jgi:YegS/Rv2252/BmrU family lipid kinase
MNEVPEQVESEREEQTEGIAKQIGAVKVQKEAAGKQRRMHVIVNPAAGLEQPILKALNIACQEAGIDWDVFVTKQAGDARRLAQEAVKSGVDLVGVHGGDGTVMEVASGLIGSDLPLAIIPGGTANVIAAELSIPRDISAATALAVNQPASVRQVDMGQVNDHYFVLRASAGFEADMVEGAQRELKDRYGVLAYAISAFQALDDLRIARYQLVLDGETVETEGLTCIVANSGAMGTNPPFNLAANIRVDDGLLDVLVVRKADLPSLISLAAAVVGGGENQDVMQHWQAREVTVQSDPPLNIQVDGEMLGQTPVTARVLPAAVNVIVPVPAERIPEHAETGEAKGEAGNVTA